LTAPDHPSPALRDRLEGAVHEAEHVFEEVALVGRAFDRITVETAAAVRHHDDQRQVGDVALDTRATGPDRVVVGEAVEEIEDRKRRRANGTLGKDHVHRARLRECRTLEVQGSEGHDKDTSDEGR
jgi:hypothetical protein